MSTPMAAGPAVGPEESAHDRITGRNRWMLGALLAQR